MVKILAESMKNRNREENHHFPTFIPSSSPLSLPFRIHLEVPFFLRSFF